jgi:hypothetical protein
MPATSWAVFDACTYVAPATERVCGAAAGEPCANLRMYWRPEDGDPRPRAQLPHRGRRRLERAKRTR